MPLSFYGSTIPSTQIMNKAANHQMTGDELQQLPSDLITPGMQVFITANSTDNQYLAGETWHANVAADGWVKDGLELHNHTSTVTGGKLPDTVLIPNLPLTIDYDKRWSKAADFWTSMASGGTVTDDSSNGRIVIDTSATNGGRASVYDGGARQLSFVYPSAFECTLLQSSNTNFKSKIGINAENIQDANTNTQKYGIEGCSLSGTVWLVFSATGTNRSTLSTSAAVVTGSPAVYRVELTPGAEVELFINGASSASKLTDVPSTGSASLNNLYKAGIQNTTAASKILYQYGGPAIVGSTA